MKRKIIIVATIITITGFTAFSFVNKRPSIDSKEKKVSSILKDQKDKGSSYFILGSPFTSNQLMNKDPAFLVRRSFSRSTTKEKLKGANTIVDIIPNYPVNWISNYVSVELMIKTDGQKAKAVNANPILTREQKEILNNSKIGSEITIDVNYKDKNPITNNLDDRKMNVVLSVLPETEAKYTGGNDQLMNYFEQSNFKELYINSPEEIQLTSILFTINEAGQVENTELTNSTGNTDIDASLIEMINKMPKWIPAKDSNGLNVKQRFTYSVGTDNC